MHRHWYKQISGLLFKDRNYVVGCLSELCVAVDITKVRGDIKVFLCVADSMHLIDVQLGTLGLKE